MLNLKDTVKILPIAATFLLTSCLESQKPLIDDSELIDPFGRDFQVSYSYADLPVIPNGKWFNSMSRNGNMFSVAFVSPEFMQETPKFSYSIAMYEWTKLQHYNYELLRFNKDEGSVYRCRTNKGSVESKYSLYKAVENEYKSLVKNGISESKCGVPTFIREDRGTPIRKPIPKLPLSLDDKKQQLSQMIDMAKFGRRHNKSNKTYDFLSRDGTLVECRGPFYGRLNYRHKSDINGKPMALLIVYLGKPERFSNHRKDFNACSVALRKVEFMMLQDAASSIGLPFVPDEITPTQMIGVDQNFKILYDSEK